VPRTRPLFGQLRHFRSEHFLLLSTFVTFVLWCPEHVLFLASFVTFVQNTSSSYLPSSLSCSGAPEHVLFLASFVTFVQNTSSSYLPSSLSCSGAQNTFSSWPASSLSFRTPPLIYLRHFCALVPRTRPLLSQRRHFRPITSLLSNLQHFCPEHVLLLSTFVTFMLWCP
jgi:hypothetical protein